MSMDSLVRKVFGVIGLCTLSLLLWGMIFVWGRPIMWGGIEPALENNWGLYTFEDGKLIDDTLTGVFDTVNDLSTK